MSDAIAQLRTVDDPDLLVGIENSDDGGVYRLRDDLAIINTVDFITPPVDDPFWFGQIAAANSLSDVYAMGGRPVNAMNLVMFPAKKLDISVLAEILRGGNEKLIEAGACLVGGHSVEDDDPKYGLSVTGVVHPDRVLTNGGALPGDAIILTKPLGTGVLFNAGRSGRLSYGLIEELLPTIATLNRTALECALGCDVHACTDVTGFGILGHLLEMSLGSGQAIEIDYSMLPIYPHALEMYRAGVSTGSNADNRAQCQPYMTLTAKLDSAQEELLFDPQTSGGLLCAIPREQADEFISAARESSVPVAAVIGKVVEGTPGVTVR